MSNIDRLCDDYETAWRAGEKPQIESFMDKVVASERDELREHLIALQEELSSGQFPVTRNIGPYKILQKLGEGGMGVVWLAEQTEPVSRRVAIKLVRADKNTPEIRARFDAERQALAMMNHPNIVKVLDAGTNERRPFYVMELIEGLPLNKYCDVNRLTIEARIRLFNQLCSAVEHLHRKGVIHRDIKPTNALVGAIDDQPVLKLIDFGLAKASAHQFKLTEKTLVTEFGQVLGTLRYISPEQAELNPLGVDRRSDIYSLGVILYELLAGSTPLYDRIVESSGRLKILQMIQDYETPRPSVRLAEYAADDDSKLNLKTVSSERRVGAKKLSARLRNSGLDWVCMKALDRDPNLRYASAAELRKELELFLDDKPVSAGRPSLGVRFSRFVKRNRKTLLSTAVSAFLVFAAIAATLWLAPPGASSDDAARRFGNYLSDVRKCWMEWQNDNVNSAWHSFVELDTECLGWEAGFMKTAFVANQKSHYLHESAINAMCLNGDKTLIATGDYAGRILVHSYPSLDVQHEFDLPMVTTLDFSPDGKQLAAGNHEGEIRVWNLDSDVTLWREKYDNIFRLKYSPDGKWIGVANNIGTVDIRDSQSGDMHLVLRAHTDSASDLRWFSDSNRILTCGHDGFVRIHSIATSELLSELSDTEEKLGCLALSPDEETLAVTATEGEVKLYDLKKKSLVHQLRGHGTAVEALCFSPDGENLLSGGGGRFDKKDSSIRIWDIETGKQIGVCKGHANTVRGLAIDTENNIVSAGYDSTIKQWDLDVATNRRWERWTTLPVTSIEFSPDDDFLCFAGFDNEIRILKYDDSKEDLVLLETLPGHRPIKKASPWYRNYVTIYREEPPINGFVTGVAFLDANRVATVGSDNQFVVRHIDGSQANKNLPFSRSQPNARDGSWSICATPDNKYLIAAGNDGKLRTWNVESNELIHEMDGTLFDAMRMAVSPNGELLLAGGKDGMLGLWEIKTGKSKWLKKSHEIDVTALCFAKDGTMVFSGDKGGDLKISNVSNGELRKALEGHNGTVTAVEPDSTGDRIISAATGGNLRVWDVESGEEFLRIAVPFDTVVTDMAINESSSHILLATSSGQILSLHNFYPTREALLDSVSESED